MATLSDLDLKRVELNSAVNDYKQAVQDFLDGTISEAQKNTARDAAVAKGDEYSKMTGQVSSDNPEIVVENLFSRAGLYTDLRRKAIDKAWGLITIIQASESFAGLSTAPKQMMFKGDYLYAIAWSGKTLYRIRINTLTSQVLEISTQLPETIRSAIMADEAILVAHYATGPTAYSTDTSSPIMKSLSLDTLSVNFTINASATGIRTSECAFARFGNRVVRVDQYYIREHNALTVMGGTTSYLTTPTQIPGRPNVMALTATRAYVSTNTGDGIIYILNRANNYAYVGQVSTGVRPTVMAVDGDRLYVGGAAIDSQNSDFTVVDLTTNTVEQGWPFINKSIRDLVVHNGICHVGTTSGPQYVVSVDLSNKSILEEYIADQASSLIYAWSLVVNNDDLYVARSNHISKYPLS
jgi:hypothetical protein